MKIYLVGGAVRDELLGRPVKDRDYVVVGSTPEEMHKLGYDQVGADFPVFLDPVTKEEYALARTERKSGTGYHGFEVNSDSTVTLEDDLRRRDLTINSMARDLETGELIDPFNGKGDIKNRCLRHTSEAFAEDPLRVLRVARFAARYEDFRIDQSTLTLMKKLVDDGEMEHLTTERVWLELEKALMERAPSHFVVQLAMCGAWERLFPQVGLVGVGYVDRAAANELSFNERVAALVVDTHIGFVENIFQHYVVSSELIRLVHNVASVRSICRPMGMSFFRLDPLATLKKVDAYRRPEGLAQVCNVLRCIGQAAENMLADELELAYKATKDISFVGLPAEVKASGGAAVGRAIDAQRHAVLTKLTFTS